jgi:hypothetical protein
LETALIISLLSMAYNHIIKKKNLGRVLSGGKALILSAATQTDYWTQLDSMAEKLKEPLGKAVESPPAADSIGHAVDKGSWSAHSSLTGITRLVYFYDNYSACEVVI